MSKRQERCEVPRRARPSLREVVTARDFGTLTGDLTVGFLKWTCQSRNNSKDKNLIVSTAIIDDPTFL